MIWKVAAFLGSALATSMIASIAMADGVTTLSLPDQIFIGTHAAAYVSSYDGVVAGFQWNLGFVEGNRRQPPFYTDRTTSRNLATSPSIAAFTTDRWSIQKVEATALESEALRPKRVRRQDEHLSKPWDHRLERPGLQHLW
jgi:hypothetical protein